MSNVVVFRVLLPCLFMLTVMVSKGFAQDHASAKAEFRALYQDVARLLTDCDTGNEQACDVVGRDMGGYRVWKFPPELLSAELKDACNDGEGLACYIYGRHVGGIGILEENPVFARALYKKSCEIGSVRGCNAYGYAWNSGLGGEKDRGKAIEYFSRACNGGMGLACINLGDAVKDQRGEADIEERAFEAYNKGCDIGFGEACSLAADFYLADAYPGEYEPDDRPLRLLEKGCGFSNRSACTGLGYILWLEALGVEQEGRALDARKIAERACMHTSLGCYLAALYLAKGYGGDADPVAAEVDLKNICKGGTVPACVILEAVEEQRTATGSVDWKLINYEP